MYIFPDFFLIKNLIIENNYILFFQETLRKIFEASKPILQAKNLDSTPINKITKSVNREQPTPALTIDPVLITTIHSNKGAIDTIHGQITELRHDVDQLRTEINNHPVPNLPSNTETRHLSNAEVNNHNPTTFSNHLHHHHHTERPVTTRSSSVCILL